MLYVNSKKKNQQVFIYNTNCTDVEKKPNNNTIIIYIYIYIYTHTILLIKQYVNFYLSIYIYIKGIC